VQRGFQIGSDLKSEPQLPYLTSDVYLNEVPVSDEEKAVGVKENKIEPVKYMTDLLTKNDKVKDNPSDWLPWNYAKTMEALNPEAATL
jgi:hypothetical protein